MVNGWSGTFLSLCHRTSIIMKSNFVVICIRRGGKTLLPNTALKVASDDSYTDLWAEVRWKLKQARQPDADDVSSVKVFDIGSSTRSKDILVDSLDPFMMELDLSLKGTEFSLETSVSAILGLDAGSSTSLKPASARKCAFDVLMITMTTLHISTVGPLLC